MEPINETSIETTTHVVKNPRPAVALAIAVGVGVAMGWSGSTAFTQTAAPPPQARAAIADSSATTTPAVDLVVELPPHSTVFPSKVGLPGGADRAEHWIVVDRTERTSRCAAALTTADRFEQCMWVA